MKKKSRAATNANVKKPNVLPLFKSFCSELTGQPITKSITYQGYFYNESDKKDVKENIPFLPDCFTNDVLEFLVDNPNATVAQILEEVTDPIDYTKLINPPVMGLSDARTYNKATFIKLPGKKSPFNRAPQHTAIIHPLAHAMVTLDEKKQNIKATTALNLKNFGCIQQQPILIKEPPASRSLFLLSIVRKILVFILCIVFIIKLLKTTDTPVNLQAFRFHTIIFLASSVHQIINFFMQSNAVEACNIFLPQYKKILSDIHSPILYSKNLLRYLCVNSGHKKNSIISELIFPMFFAREYKDFSIDQLSVALFKINLRKTAKHLKAKRSYLKTNFKRLLVTLISLSAVAEPLLCYYLFAAESAKLSEVDLYFNQLQKIAAPVYILQESACNIHCAVRALPEILNEKKPFFSWGNFELLSAFVLCLSAVFFTQNPEISFLLFATVMNAYCRDKFVYSTSARNPSVLLRPLIKIEKVKEEKVEIKITEQNLPSSTP